MTRHTSHGSIPSVWQDDGFGTLRRINFQQLIARIESGWKPVTFKVKSMKYTNKERRAIADIFKTVRKKMKRNQPWGDQHYSRYICDNIADLYCNEIDKSLAGQVVKERINYEFSVEYWLVQEGCISKGFAEEARYGDRHSFEVKQMHAYRLRWLKSLAAEFSANEVDDHIYQRMGKT